MRRVLRVAAVVAVIGCLTLFFSVGSGGSGTGSRQESWLSVGQPWPWYESRMVQEVRPDGLFGSSESGVIPNSPAWLLLAGAGAAVVVFRQLRPRDTRAVAV